MPELIRIDADSRQDPGGGLPFNERTPPLLEPVPMPVHLADPRCLRPRRTSGTVRDPAAAHRVDGVLHRAAQPPRTLFIDAIDYDGERCRYRIAGSSGSGDDWVTEGPGDEYQSCARRIVQWLRALGDTDSSRLSVVDSLIGPRGHLWVAVRDETRRRSRWLPIE